MKDILNSYSVTELKKEVSKTNIKNYSKLKKPELIELMMKFKERFMHLKMKDKKQPKAKAKPAPKAKPAAKPAPKPTAKPAAKPAPKKEKPKKDVRKELKEVLNKNFKSPDMLFDSEKLEKELKKALEDEKGYAKREKLDYWEKESHHLQKRKDLNLFIMTGEPYNYHNNKSPVGIQVRKKESDTLRQKYLDKLLSYGMQKKVDPEEILSLYKKNPAPTLKKMVYSVKDFKKLIKKMEELAVKKIDLYLKSIKKNLK